MVCFQAQLLIHICNSFPSKTIVDYLSTFLIGQPTNDLLLLQQPDNVKKKMFIFYKKISVSDTIVYYFFYFNVFFIYPVPAIFQVHRKE
jgi:hypothetical protein